MLSLTCFAFQTSRTGMPAITELGSSWAAEFTVSFAPITRARSVSGKSSLISSISRTMSYGTPASATKSGRRFFVDQLPYFGGLAKSQSVLTMATSKHLFDLSTHLVAFPNLNMTITLQLFWGETQWEDVYFDLGEGLRYCLYQENWTSNKLTSVNSPT